MLCAKRIGYSVAELDEFTVGMFIDVCACSSGAEEKETPISGQEAINTFFGR